MPSMEFLVATGIGWVTACGIYLLLRGRSFAVVLGLSLIGYAVNVFIFAMVRPRSPRSRRYTSPSRPRRRCSANTDAHTVPIAMIATPTPSMTVPTVSTTSTKPMGEQ